MRAEARHQLKQDRFSKVTLDAAERTVDWSSHHKLRLIVACAAVVVIAAAGFFVWYTLNQQDQSASLELNQAIRTLDTPLRPAGTPAEPENPTFTSATERAAEAHKQFQAIADKYPHTHSAAFARYFVGLTDVDMGDTAGAIRDLQSVAGSRNEGLAALANFALASVYRNQGNNKQAITLYNQLAAKPTSTVSKATAQLELAATYEADQQPLEAQKVYRQIQKENPTNPAGQLAAEKLQGQK